MTENKIQELRKESTQYRVSPSERVWEQLEQKLDNDTVHRKLHFYRIAAAVLLTVCLTVSALYISDKQGTRDIARIDSAVDSRFLLEDLGTELEEGIYDMQRLRTLMSFYEKNGSSVKNLH